MHHLIESMHKCPEEAISNDGGPIDNFASILLRGAARICLKGGTTFSNYR